MSVFVSDGLCSSCLSNRIGLRKGCKDFGENHQIKLFAHGVKSQNNDINNDSEAACCSLDDCRLILYRIFFSSQCSGQIQNVPNEKNRETWNFITVYNSVTSVPVYTLSTKFVLFKLYHVRLETTSLKRTEYNNGENIRSQKRKHIMKTFKVIL